MSRSAFPKLARRLPAWRTHAFAFLLCLGAHAPLRAAQPPFQVDEHTAFLLEPDLKANTLVDRTGHVAPLVKDGAAQADDRFPAAWKLSAAGDGITIKDDGRLHFEDGVTI